MYQLRTIFIVNEINIIFNTIQVFCSREFVRSRHMDKWELET